ncbi:MAG: hypothetical protein E6G94_16540 [Alphaproteobacteria bacterium]|nr:MAG: hypothetical protein E6G94_16540 [Alphaproteobacteria bacterium]
MLALSIALASLAAGQVPAAAAPAPAAAAPGPAQVNDDELILFAVELDGTTLTEGLTAYGDPADPYLPIGELSRLLELDLRLTPASGRVTGTLGESRQSLIVDLPAGLARSGGSDVRISPDDARVSLTDIYVKASVLAQLLPIGAEVDSEALTVRLKPTSPLPVQSRLERAARLRSLGHDIDQGDEVLRIESPYELFSPPAFDVILETGSDTRSRPFSRRFDVRAAGDLLYTGFQGFVGSDEEGRPADARILFERRSLKGNLLGPLGATRVSGGDVFTPSLAYGPRSVAGRGISFTTAPLEQASVFETIDLRGELPIGYDVELYINDVLRSGQRAPVQGRYEFLDGAGQDPERRRRPAEEGPGDGRLRPGPAGAAAAQAALGGADRRPRRGRTARGGERRLRSHHRHHRGCRRGVLPHPDRRRPPTRHRGRAHLAVRPRRPCRRSSGQQGRDRGGIRACGASRRGVGRAQPCRISRRLRRREFAGRRYRAADRAAQRAHRRLRPSVLRRHLHPADPARTARRLRRRRIELDRLQPRLDYDPQHAALGGLRLSAADGEARDRRLSQGRAARRDRLGLPFRRLQMAASRGARL